MGNNKSEKCVITWNEKDLRSGSEIITLRMTIGVTQMKNSTDVDPSSIIIRLSSANRRLSSPEILPVKKKRKQKNSEIQDTLKSMILNHFIATGTEYRF